MVRQEPKIPTLQTVGTRPTCLMHDALKTSEWGAVRTMKQ
jgi:hypothetical protein